MFYWLELYFYSYLYGFSRSNIYCHWDKIQMFTCNICLVDIANLAYAFDCISKKESTKQVCAALTSKWLLSCTYFTERDKECSVLMWREVNVFRKVFKGRSQDKEFTEKFYKLLSDVLLPDGFVNEDTRWTQWSRKWWKIRLAAENLVYTVVSKTTKQHNVELNSNL
jgi:hypothetical protein